MIIQEGTESQANNKTNDSSRVFKESDFCFVLKKTVSN